MRYVLAVLALASPATAQDALSAAEFEAWVGTQTYYSSRKNEAPYGMLLFRQNRQVTWASFGDECLEGSWSEPLPGVICFYYPDSIGEHCWQFYDNNGELNSTVYQGNGDIYVDTPTNDTMPCLGPYIGS